MKKSAVLLRSFGLLRAVPHLVIGHSDFGFPPAPDIFRSLPIMLPHGPRLSSHAIFYWLALATWFGGVMFVTIAAP